MKAQELRIGNHFQVNVKGGSVRGGNSWEIIIGIKLYTITGSSGTVYLLSNIEPIPLTEDWLKRLKMEYKAINESYRGRYLILTITGVTYYFFTDTNTLERDAMPIKIEFVHQIQNLTFALTGTELKTKS